MLRNRFIELLCRKMAGDATAEELHELQQLVEGNDEWKMIYTEMSAEISDDLTEEEYTNAAALYAAHSVTMELNGRFEGKKTIFRSMRIPAQKAIAVAAILVLAIGGFYAFEKWNPADKKLMANQVITKKGNKSNITLQDGTQVVMNSDSKLSYGSDFGDKMREVKLQGEAFFDVAHNAAKPFIIHTGNINIKVLGTAFNVKSYPEDGIVETSLIRGRIEITFNDSPNETIILKPGEKLVVKNGQGTISGKSIQDTESKITKNNISVLEDSLVVETAWLTNRIVFSNESLENIAHELERKFDVEFVFKNNSAKGYSYTGNYEKESLEKILQQMNLSRPFNYQVVDKKIIIE